MPDEMPKLETLMHKGRQTNIMYVGGDYNGDLKRMRAPINPIVEVAKPPRYLGDNNYDGNISSLGYQTYHLRELDGIKYYVWSEWLEDWHNDPNSCLGREYETDNQRAMRLEEEEKERHRKEVELQKKLAKKDFEELGIAIEGPGGKRIDPRTVRIFINANHEGVRKKFIVREKF